MLQDYSQKYAGSKNLGAIEDIPRQGWEKLLGSQPQSGHVSIRVMQPFGGEIQELVSGELLGLSFEKRENDIYVFAEGLSHKIDQPDSVAAFTQDGKTTIAIHDKGDRLHVVEINSAELSGRGRREPTFH